MEQKEFDHIMAKYLRCIVWTTLLVMNSFEILSSPTISKAPFNISLYSPLFLDTVSIHDFRDAEIAIQGTFGNAKYVVRVTLESLSHSDTDVLGWHEDFSWTFDTMLAGRCVEIQEGLGVVEYRLPHFSTVL